MDCKAVSDICLSLWMTMDDQPDPTLDHPTSAPTSISQKQFPAILQSVLSGNFRSFYAQVRIEPERKKHFISSPLLTLASENIVILPHLALSLLITHLSCNMDTSWRSCHLEDSCLSVHHVLALCCFWK